MFNQRLCVSQLPTDVSYLASDYPKHRRCSAMTSHQFSDPHILLEAYRQRARRFKKMLSQYLQTPIIYTLYIYSPSRQNTCILYSSFYFPQWFFSYCSRLVEIASRQYQVGVESGMDKFAAWNSSSVDWTVAAKVCTCTTCTYMWPTEQIVLYCYSLMRG